DHDDHGLPGRERDGDLRLQPVLVVIAGERGALAGRVVDVEQGVVGGAEGVELVGAGGGRREAVGDLGRVGVGAGGRQRVDEAGGRAGHRLRHRAAEVGPGAGGADAAIAGAGRAVLAGDALTVAADGAGAAVGGAGRAVLDAVAPAVAAPGAGAAVLA